MFSHIIPSVPKSRPGQTVTEDCESGIGHYLDFSFEAIGIECFGLYGYSLLHLVMLLLVGNAEILSMAIRDGSVVH